jgi:ribonuclease VapC
VTLVIDTSVVVAMILRDSATAGLVEKLGRASERLVPAPCLGEAYLVLSARLGAGAGKALGEWCREVDVETVAFGPEHVPWFHHAHDRFGRGRHKAALNFGDCFSYAVAKAGNHPLLFTGNDFSLTDLVAA